MKFRFLHVVILIFAVLAFSSCKKSNETGKYIPKNASVVIHMNGEALNAKLPWEEIKKNQLFEKIYQDTSLGNTMRSALDNPENTGIDIKKDMMFYIQMDSAGSLVAFQGKVKDAEKFKSFYSSATKGTAVTGEKGLNSVSNDTLTATWNNDRFLILFGGPAVPQNPFPGGEGNIFDTTEKVMAPQPAIKRDLKALSPSLFNLNEDNSLAKDERFGELMAKKGDMRFWINIEESNKANPAMPGMSMVNMAKLYEGSVMTGVADFMDGKIEVDLKSYAGKEFSNLLKKYEGSPFKEDMVKKIISKDVAAVLAMNFKPAGLLEFVKLTGLEGFANMGASMLGFTLDDFVQANKGDILIAVTDVKKDTAGRFEGDFLFAASINNKEAFNKLVAAGLKASKSPQGNRLPSVTYKLSDEYFAIGNRQQSVNGFFANNKNDHAFLSDMSGSPVGMYINFQRFLLANTPAPGADSAKTALYNASVSMWDNMYARGGKYEDGGMTGKVTINLVDKKTNSLKQLNNYLGLMSTFTKSSRSNENWKDSSVVIMDTTVAMR